MFGLTTTRRHEREINALEARLAQAIEQRNTARSERQAFRAAAETAGRQFAEADATNRRLSGRVEELGRRNSTLAESDPDHLADLEQQLADVRRELAAEKKRVERLQRRYDDAVGLTSSGIKDSSPWQPGYQPPKPKADAS